MKLKTATTWFRRTGIHEPERCLVAAIMYQAWRDVKKGRPAHAYAAVDYFLGENFENDCQWLDIDPVIVRDAVRRKAAERGFVERRLS